jgi:formylglycine-generating enzyme required for sulfatase activity
VNWIEATAFCEWLTQHGDLPRTIALARLPTEAEWEYACRGCRDARRDPRSEFYNGDGEAALAEVGWYDGNSGGETHPVDERDENHPFGLFGVHGNVWQWCRDVYEEGAYRRRTSSWAAQDTIAAYVGEDSKSPASEIQARVLRGGSWGESARECRSAYRRWDWAGNRDWNYGFRVCLVPGPAAESTR